MEGPHNALVLKPFRTGSCTVSKCPKMPVKSFQVLRLLTKSVFFFALANMNGVKCVCQSNAHSHTARRRSLALTRKRHLCLVACVYSVHMANASVVNWVNVRQKIIYKIIYNL